MLASLWAVLLPAAAKRAPAEDLRQAYEQIHGGNRLDAKGQTPFHIRVAAQLYDLDGHPSETASVQEWWAAGQYRIEIDSPEGKQVQTSEVDFPRLSSTRTAFLLRELLNQSVNPLNDLQASVILKSVDRDFEGSRFRCLSADWSGRGIDPGSAALYCTAPGSTDLRLVLGGTSFVEVRNQIARFHGAAIALKTSRVYLGKLAISGEVKELQVFDPTTSRFPEFSQEELEKNKPNVEHHLVVAGKLLMQQRPEYPELAKITRLSGKVILVSVIGRTGKIASLDVLASPSPILSEEALKAVRNWTYSPFTLDGKAVEVQQLVEVNFSR